MLKECQNGEFVPKWIILRKNYIYVLPWCSVKNEPIHGEIRRLFTNFQGFVIVIL